MNPRDRVPAIDGARALAFAAVVTIHAVGRLAGTDAGALARFVVGASDWAVPALFMLSGYVTSLRGHTPENVRRWIVRLGVPYVIWSVLYAGLLAVLGMTRQFSAAGVFAAVALGHTASHLWFLPALIVAHLTGMLTRGRRGLLAGLLLTAPLFIARILIPESQAVAYSILRYSPAGWVFVYLLGILVSRTRSIALTPQLVRTVCVCAPLLMGATIITLGEGAAGRALITAAGVGISLCVLFDIHGGGDALSLARLAGFGAAAFPAYLIHMVPLYTLPEIMPSVVPLWVVFLICAVVVAGSWYVGSALGRVRVLRWAFGEMPQRPC